ncbi:hypothetical protein [Luteimonas terricola]|uniref:Polysaccharide deacetylase n=1 Tax=Luteimonas terricola TaxID=645597 RepID=A0ABQ2E9R8_9GAMM|nr:hypothetical protein [Luteimonas terricola]GGK01519.1 hypothetical protein GCM10011394_08410 [Luteimonas terricola]
MTGSELARRLGMDELPQRARQAWLANVEAALAEHQVGFAVLPMHQLLGDGEMLETLAARGYVVDAP